MTRAEAFISLHQLRAEAVNETSLARAFEIEDEVIELREFLELADGDALAPRYVEE